MLAIQKFLRSHNPKSAVRHAEEMFGLKSVEQDDLVLFNYSMIDSKRGVQEVEECRGLILERPSWNVVAMPFYRFYNADERPYAYSFNNWDPNTVSGSILWEKRDGTLITLYHYKDQWRVATRGRPYADGSVGDHNSTFHELFWETWRTYGGDLTNLPKDVCYMFELTGPCNRVVTPYEKNELRILSARVIDNKRSEYTEAPLSVVATYGKSFMNIEMPKTYTFKSVDHIKNQLNTIGGLDEGFVLMNPNEYIKPVGECKTKSYPRVKIKNPSYLNAARLIGNGFSEKKALEMVLTGPHKVDTFTHFFPEYEGVVKRVGDRVTVICDDIENTFNKIKHLTTRKEFAEAAKQHCAPWVLFRLLDSPDKYVFELLSDAGVDRVFPLI